MVGDGAAFMIWDIKRVGVYCRRLVATREENDSERIGRDGRKEEV